MMKVNDFLEKIWTFSSSVRVVRVVRGKKSDKSLGYI